jgi:hypothetical protein
LVEVEVVEEQPEVLLDLEVMAVMVLSLPPPLSLLVVVVVVELVVLVFLGYPGLEEDL